MPSTHIYPITLDQAMALWRNWTATRDGPSSPVCVQLRGNSYKTLSAISPADWPFPDAFYTTANHVNNIPPVPPLIPQD